MRFAFIFLFISTFASAQQEYFEREYVDAYTDYLQISFGIAPAYTNAAIRTPTTFFNTSRSNTAPSIQLQYDRWGFGISLPNPFAEKTETKQIGVQAQVFPRLLSINFSFQRWNGLEHSWDIKEMTEYEFENVRMLRTKLNPVYIFNNRRFSLQSIYQLNHHQLVSGGSMLTGLIWEQYLLKGDEQPRLDFEPYSFTNKYRFRQMGLDVGYAHTIVLSEQLYLAGVARSAFVHSKVAYTQEGDRLRSGELRFIPFHELLFSIGYQGSRYFGALQLQFHNQQITGVDQYLKDDGVQLQLIFGFRLYQPGIGEAIRDGINWLK